MEHNISAIEQFVINKVREMRKERKISQAELANLIEVSHGFIGKVESKNYRDKYNLNHINEIARIFRCAPGDLLPPKPLKSKPKT